MAEQDTDLEELNRQHALRAHQVHYSYLEKGNEATIASGQAAVKNLFLMHGGALVAMLAFTSGILNNSASVVQVDSLVDPMMRFAIGLACAAAASAGTYLTNYCYVAGAQLKTLIWQHPYIEEASASKVWEGVGVAFHVLTVLLALGSLLLFISGFWGVKGGLETAKMPDVATEVSRQRSGGAVEEEPASVEGHPRPCAAVQERPGSSCPS